MRTVKTHPSDGKQTGFFEVYAQLDDKVKIGVILAQFLSIVTEFSVIYMLGYNAIAWYSLEVASWIGIITGIIGVLLIEIFGLRFLLPKSVDAFLYKRFSGLEAVLSIFCVVLTVALICCSCWISLKGKSEVVGYLVEESLENSVKEQGVVSDSFNVQSRQFFVTDSVLISERIQRSIDIENERYRNDSIMAASQLEFWKSKGDRYKTRTHRASVAINKSNVDHLSIIAKLENDLSVGLDSLARQKLRRDENTELLEKMSVDDLKGKAKENESTYDDLGEWVVILAMIFAVVGIIINRIYEKLAGIQRKPLSNWFFRDSIVSEFVNTINDHIQTHLRNAIALLQAKVPNRATPTLPFEQYDESVFKPTLLVMEIEELEESARIVKIPAPEIEIDPTRRRIGFKDYHASNAMRKSSLKSSNKIGNCQCCEKEYQKRTTWQKYCSEACRISAWESRTGRRFKK